jgi:hypothetical protein
MLKTNNIEITKIKFDATNVSVTFEEPDVHPDQYYFLKDRLNNYKLYINSEYSFKSELQYDKSSQILSIGIDLIIPEHYVPTDPIIANDILMDPINIFQIFYDAQNEIYKRNNLKK